MGGFSLHLRPETHVASLKGDLIQSIADIMPHNTLDLNVRSPGFCFFGRILSLRDGGRADQCDHGVPYEKPHVQSSVESPFVDTDQSPGHCLLGVLRHFQAATGLQFAIPSIPVLGSGSRW